ncbi:formate dehydrogenase accessory sulfurtransferase FdhD [Bradyrhizobium sp. ARR65]|uniref:formate dehydrogenase accessory sulfurtransferase FdhD n=1 Tax=Bradyrhizobium sp. ARR65 TaxID=1040989 RepID=UPI000467A5A2|nr:formate dehydrogenase accessory sulfurtransferase FdhD [Bradyrhizobium sp. ARR65]
MSALGFEEFANLQWRGAVPTRSLRPVAEESAIALTYNGSTYAVMMATPGDLGDFAVGFSVTEGVIEGIDEVQNIDIIETELGIEVRMWLVESRAERLVARRRATVGPVGCGLCGMESLEQTQRPPRPVKSHATFDARELLHAMCALGPQQQLNRRTRSVHAAAFWRPSSGIAAVREDVGRHNALDKLAGAMLAGSISACDGAVLLTSRVSVEMVQKTAMMAVPVLMAMSAPTALAIRTADAAGITLIAVARHDGYEVFTHPDRITFPVGAAHCALQHDYGLPIA